MRRGRYATLRRMPLPPATRRRLPALVLAGALPLLLAASEAKEQELVPQLPPAEVAEALKEGGYVILLRHTSTGPPVTDPDVVVDFADCSTQRNLSEQGRAEARRMGEAFTEMGIPVGEVLSSPYCRCVETGELAFGKATPETKLVLGGDMKDRIDGGAEVRALMDQAPEAGHNNVLITHTVTLLYSFGLKARPEGIAHVFKPTGIGRPTYIGMLTPDQWPAGGGAADAAE